MADVFSKAKRSDIMSRIRSSGTLVEKSLYALLRASVPKGTRIRRNVRSVPGRPDVVIESLRLVIFADGCFYHSCPRHGRIPKSNEAYWKPKLDGNARRDRKRRATLRRQGYRVWRLWEHELEGKRLEATGRKLRARLHKLILAKECELRLASNANAPI